jgi:preprotein translocase subunit SecF
VNNGYFLKFGAMGDTEFRSLSAVIYQKFPDAKVDQIGETFGKTLQSQAVLALVFSFIGMAIVIFVAFRTFVPSVAVVLSAFADMVMTAATMNIVGIPLSLGPVLS